MSRLRLSRYHKRWGIVLGEVWSDVGTLADITLGAPAITTTFKSLNMELPFTEVLGGATVTAVTCEYRTNGVVTPGQAFLPLWPTRPGHSFTITLNATGGTWRIAYGGVESATDLSWQATASQVSTALAGIAGVGANKFTVSGTTGTGGTPSGPFTVAQGSASWNTMVDAVTTNPAGLTGGAGTAAVVRTSPTWAAYGKVFPLTHNTAYQVRFAVTDSTGQTVKRVATATTRNDNIPAANTLTPTLFVRTDGSDTNDGSADDAAHAWLTLAKVKASAPSGAVVQLGPGHFKGFSAANNLAGFTNAVTLVAKFPCLDDDRNQINVGNWTFIDGAVECGPTGSGFAIEAPWTSESIQGAGIAANYEGSVLPDPVPSYSCWKWTNGAPSVVAGISSLSYSATRDGLGKRMLTWRPDTGITTAAQFVEYVHTNQDVRWGVWNANNNADLYMVMPAGENPNDYWWVGGWSRVLAFNAGPSRVSGCVIRAGQQGVDFSQNADDSVLDHCIIDCCRYPVYTSSNGNAGNHNLRTVIERNYLRDTSLWTLNQATDPAAPWTFMKQNLRRAGDPAYNGSSQVGSGPSSPGRFMEGSAIYGRFCGRDLTYRRNTIVGTFNGPSNGSNDSAGDRYFGSGIDVYENTIRDGGDDGIEPEGFTLNFGCWDNRVERYLTVLSTGPVEYGPVYMLRNSAWRIGTGMPANYTSGVANAISGVFFKFSGTSDDPRGRIFAINNTFWTDITGVTNGEDYASLGVNNEAQYHRNNIYRGTRYGYAFPRSPQLWWDADYNQYSTSDATRGFKDIAGGLNLLSMATYRSRLATLGVAIDKRDEHSNPAGDVQDYAALDALLTDPTNGDLTLTVTGQATLLGTDVPGVTMAAVLGHVVRMGYVP